MAFDSCALKIFSCARRKTFQNLPWRRIVIDTRNRRLSNDSKEKCRHKPLSEIDLSLVPKERIRNFSIIAHIDHGKSTLSDRMLEHVGAISPIRPGGPDDRVLDKLKVEKDRGITVKAQTVSLMYNSAKDGKDYLLNLVDTPGHVDFSSEVSRSLTACQGVILLVDANQGVQAQTVSNFYMAFGNDLIVVPVLNKIDLPNAKPDEVKEQLNNLFDIDPSSVIAASAKTGVGISDIFEAVVERIPPPSLNQFGEGEEDVATALRLLLFDSWYDRYRGTVNLVQVVSGVLRAGHEQVVSVTTGKAYSVKTLALLTPGELPVSALYPGQMGVMTCNMRKPKEAMIGDTFHRKDQPVKPLISAALTRPKPMVFAGIYPLDQSEQNKLRDAIAKVCLNDYSVSCQTETSPALGTGWRLGFLGILHMEVFTQRLEDEYGASVLVTSPGVPYRLQLNEKEAKKYDCDENFTYEVRNPNLWPEKPAVKSYQEPYVRGTIICPSDYTAKVNALAAEARGQPLSMVALDQHRVKLEFHLPLAEIVTDFFDNLKNVTSGYGSFDYEEAGYRESKLMKVDILLNDVVVPELATVMHSSKAKEKSKKTVARLTDLIPRQQFAIKVQAAVGSKIIARGDVKPVRKDVTAKLYGGDLTRKMKKLHHQAEGKKRMRAVGNVQLSQDIFRKLLT